MPVETIGLDLPGSPFFVRDVLIEYDGPLLFSIESPRVESIWLLVAVDDTHESTTYLASQVRPLILQSVATGRRDLRDAFVGAFCSPDTQALVRYDANGWSVAEYPLTEWATEEMLPRLGARIRVPIRPFEAYEPSRLAALANDSKRACWALEVHPGAVAPGEIGVSLLTEILDGFQSSVSEMALELRGHTGKEAVGVSIRSQTELIYQASMAASFVAVLAAPTPESEGVLFYQDQELLETTTSRVLDLIRLAASDTSGALDALRGSSKGVRKEFRKLITTVMRTQGGIAVDQAIPGRHVEQARITPKQAQTLEALMRVEHERVELPPFEASLVGMNVESKTFSLRYREPVPGLGDETKLSGRLDKLHADELLEHLPSLVVGTGTRYWASVSIIPSDFEPDGAPFTKPKLVWLEVITSDQLPNTNL